MTAQFLAAPFVPWQTVTLGETQLCSADGVVLARLTLEDGEAHVAADIIPGAVAPIDPLTDRFWIPGMSMSTHVAAWHAMNNHGRLDYRLKKVRGKHEWQSWPAGDLPDELPPVPDEQAQHFATTP